ncbi:MAG: YkvA family protein [Hyphomicrobiaceae bacterium]
MLARLRQWARAIRRDAHALYLAARDPRLPWPVKLLAAAIAAYALSPIDLIPDFVPILGYLDDLIILPLAILLVMKLVPPAIMAEHRAIADQAMNRPVSRGAVVVIGVVWAASAVLVAAIAWRIFHG